METYGEIRIHEDEGGYAVTAPGFYCWEQTRSEARDWLRLLRRERTRRLRRVIARRNGSEEPRRPQNRVNATRSPHIREG